MLGVVLGSSRTLDDAFSVIVEVLRPIPAVAIIPLAILVFGLGPPMLRFVIAYAAVWPILINTIYGVRGGDRLHHDVARTSGVTGLGRLVRVTLPGALPSIATGVRVSASIALLVCVTAEFLAASDGIGAYMQRQQSPSSSRSCTRRSSSSACVGYVVNVLLRLLQSRVVFWVGEERAGGRDDRGGACSGVAVFVAALGLWEVVGAPRGIVPASAGLARSPSGAGEVWPTDASSSPTWRRA